MNTRKYKKKENEGGGHDEGRKMSGMSQGKTSRRLKPKRSEVRMNTKVIIYAFHIKGWFGH